MQIKIGTGEHDLMLKASKISEWLTEGHKVKLDLYLTGRSKGLGLDFLKGRLDRILKLISVPYKIDEPKRGPKGLTAMIEKSK